MHSLRQQYILQRIPTATITTATKSTSNTRIYEDDEDRNDGEHIIFWLSIFCPLLDPADLRKPILSTRLDLSEYRKHMETPNCKRKRPTSEIIAPYHTYGTGTTLQ